MPYKFNPLLSFGFEQVPVTQSVTFQSADTESFTVKVNNVDYKLPIYKVYESIIERNPNYLGSYDTATFASQMPSMLASLSAQRAYLGTFSLGGVAGLFLGIANDGSMTLEQLKNKANFQGTSIAEWTLVADNSYPEAKVYLDYFGPKGLKPYGMIIWTVSKLDPNSVGYFIINTDGTIFSSDNSLRAK